MLYKEEMERAEVRYGSCPTPWQVYIWGGCKDPVEEVFDASQRRNKRVTLRASE